MHAELDALGRRGRLAPRPTGKRVSPTAKDRLWFAALAEHGPLPTTFLLAFAEGRYASEKRARERLTDLFHEDNTPHGGPYLTRPPQQFRTLDSRYNQLVYDLAPAGWRALDGEPHTTPSGPWLHRFMTGCVTGSVELAALQRPDLSYISQSKILARAGVEFRFPVTLTDPSTGRRFIKDLIPDAVFGLAYHTASGDRFRFFAVEADRATEPTTANTWNRKSFERNLFQYDTYVADGVYQEHLRLTAPLLVLNVLSDARRLTRMVEFTARRYPRGNAFMLFQAWEDFGPVFRPPVVNPDLLFGAWQRGGLGPFRLDEV